MKIGIVAACVARRGYTRPAQWALAGSNRGSPTTARIVTTHYRYKRPPRNRRRVILAFGLVLATWGTTGTDGAQ